MDYKIVKLRFLAILIVVFGHSIIIYDPNWQVYATTNVVNLLMYIKHLINTFQMPLFIFISGFCFGYSLKKHRINRLSDSIHFIVEKFKRLIVPFFFIAIFWMLPIRIMCRYPSWKSITIFSILKQLILGIDSGHLWFLPTLFIIFILSILFYPRINIEKQNIIILVFLFVVSVFSNKLPSVFFIKNISYGLYWFYLGFIFCNYKHKINNLFKDERTILALVIINFLILLAIVLYFKENLLITMFTEFFVSSLIILLYFLVSACRTSVFVNLISKYSMGIYLFHSPLIYFVYSYYPNLLPVVVVFINFVCMGLLSFSITHFFVKNKHIKWLIGY